MTIPMILSLALNVFLIIALIVATLAIEGLKRTIDLEAETIAKMRIELSNYEAILYNELHVRKGGDI